jgi:protein N-terminal methyltransferase
LTTAKASSGTSPSTEASQLATTPAEEQANRHEWYKKGAAYWEKTEASVNGVLGGFGHVSPIDVSSSKEFLRDLKVNKGVAIDCGAGIGRVAKELLLPIFQVVDLVEQCPIYVEKAKDLIKDKRLENFYCLGLQNYQPVTGRYDVIWVQWVLGHLPDDDFVAFFSRCKSGLKTGGYICVKENALKEGFLYDNDDESVTRCDALLKSLFTRAGLCVVNERVQKRFPKELFPVKMYALQPAVSTVQI